MKLRILILPKKFGMFMQFKKSGHNLSIIGKICVINSLAMSKLMYLASVLGRPDGSKLAGVHKDMFAFIWNIKPDQIKCDILFKNTEDGSLGLKKLSLMFKS